MPNFSLDTVSLLAQSKRAQSLSAHTESAHSNCEVRAVLLQPLNPNPRILLLTVHSYIAVKIQNCHLSLMNLLKGRGTICAVRSARVNIFLKNAHNLTLRTPLVSSQ
jgi:hypothetical protein